MSRRLMPLTLVGIMWAPSAHAQGPTLTLSEPWFQSGTTEHTWKYRVRLTNVSASTTFILNLRTPQSVLVRDIRENGVASTSRRQSPFTVVSIEAEGNAAVSLIVTGPAADLQHGPAVEHQWSVAGQTAERVHAAAPEQRYDPSLVRPVLGIGGSLLMDDHVDFRLSEDGNTLLVLNDSKTRMTAAVGALFNVPGPVDILASFSFTEQTAHGLDGVMFGVAVDLNRYLSIGGGYALRRGSELAPGFRRHAEAAIMASPEKYKVFEDTSCLHNDSLYDGFPLKDENEMKVFPGPAITESTNHSWFLGIFVPLDFRDWITSRSGT